VNYAIKQRAPVASRVSAAMAARDTFVLSPVVHYELTRHLKLRGARRLMRAYQTLVATWQPCDIVGSDWDLAADLWEQRHRAGAPINDADLLIAVSAIKTRSVLVTNNVSHSRDSASPSIIGHSPEEPHAAPSESLRGPVRDLRSRGFPPLPPTPSRTPTPTHPHTHTSPGVLPPVLLPDGPRPARLTPPLPESKARPASGQGSQPLRASPWAWDEFIRGVARPYATDCSATPRRK
jgi:predicted nucleic acid-binding protein